MDMEGIDGRRWEDLDLMGGRRIEVIPSYYYIWT